jgi:hypothetical protein
VLLDYALPLLALLGLLAWRRRGALLPALAALLVVAAATATNKLGFVPGWVRHAYLLTFAPTLTAAVASLLSRLARTPRGARITAASVLVAGALSAALTAGALRPRATDVLEASWVARWRERVPTGSCVVYLSRAGARVLLLPLYDACGIDGADMGLLSTQRPPPEVGELAAQVYYYRSSLCSTPEGRGYCEALERTLTLEPLEGIEGRDLPAVASMHELNYDRPTVRVGLFRVRATDRPRERNE